MYNMSCVIENQLQMIIEKFYFSSNVITFVKHKPFTCLTSKPWGTLSDR